MSKLYIPSPPTIAGLQVALSAGKHFTGTTSKSPNQEVSLDLGTHVLRDPSTICRIVGAPLIPTEAVASAFVDQWLAYDVSLSNSVNQSSLPAVREALLKIDKALANSSHLAGSQLTLADLVVFGSLFPVLCEKGGSLHAEAPKKVKGWFGTLAAVPDVAETLSSLKVTSAGDIKLGVVPAPYTSPPKAAKKEVKEVKEEQAPKKQKEQQQQPTKAEAQPTKEAKAKEVKAKEANKKEAGGKEESKKEGAAANKKEAKKEGESVKKEAASGKKEEAVKKEAAVKKEDKPAKKVEAPKVAAPKPLEEKKQVVIHAKPLVRDVSWNPLTPPGHTTFSWRVQRRGCSTTSATGSGKAPVFRDETPRVRLPEAGKRNILITSALPYVNNVPHLGNIIGCVLSADAYSRYCRLRGWNSVYVCGTDEYGTATEAKAIEAGMTPQEICDKFHKIHKEIYEWFDIKFDKFGRTTTKYQTIIAQDIFNKCQANGFVHEQDVTQLWCQEFGFLADRFVFGVCPICGYEDARGDQCDKCGNLLNATELINPKAKLNPEAKVTTKVSKHLFLDLPSLVEPLDRFVNKSSVEGKWSQNSISTTAGWIRDGLKPRCITRDLKWGTPVPCQGYEDKVFYVWFDAPIGYLSITNSYTDQWEKWWKNPQNVELVQFMGKDNIPFHTVIFPCSLLGTKENYTMLHHINTTEYLNYEQGKFSKSRGVGVFGDDAKASGIESSVWRYYLFVNRPEVSDSVFTWTDFAMKNNNELLANLGNFVNRILSFLKTRFGGVVPAVCLEEDPEFVKAIQARITNYVALFDAVKIKEALREAMGLSGEGNRFMQENEPWKLLKAGKAERSQAVLAICVNVVYWLAILLEPFMPACTAKILKQLNFGIVEDALVSDRFVCHIPAGHVIGEPELLFTRVEDDKIEMLREKHAGTQDERRSGPVFPLDVRVGVINKVESHPSPDADALYVLSIDVGEEKDRTVASGLKEKFTPEQLQGRKVLVVCNGKDFDFKGVVSTGMVLTAEKNKTVELLSVEAPAGTAICPHGGTLGFSAGFDLRSTFKKLDIRVEKDGSVVFMNAPLQTQAGAVVKTSLGSGAKVR